MIAVIHKRVTMGISVWLIGMLILTLMTDGNLTEECGTPRYLEHNQNGIINCSFTDGFYGVYWYDSEDTVQSRPMISITNGVRGGSGFVSGEYNIDIDGSLIIIDVSIAHEHNFTALMFLTQSALPTRFTVPVYVIVKPSEHFPVIDQCGKTNRICFYSFEKEYTISCSVAYARPAVDINWARRVAEGDISIISQDHNVISNNVTFTSHAVVKSTSFNSGHLSLLVCKASMLPALLISNESVLLVQNQIFRPDSANSEKLVVEKDSTIVMQCVESNLYYLVWTRFYDNVVEDVAWAIFLRDNITTAISENIEIGVSGSLQIHNIQPHHEGLYSCTYNDGINDNTNVYDVSIYVSPIPFYPVVSGCNENRYCVLEVQREGTLTCSLLGVRPVVRLKVTTFLSDESTKITVTNEETIVTSNGDGYDVVLKAKYILNTDQHSITLECKTYGEHTDLFELSKKFEILFLEESNTKASQQTPTTPIDQTWKLLLIIFVSLIGLLICGFGLFLILKSARGRRNQQEDSVVGQSKQIKQEETIQLMSAIYPTDPIEVKTREFLNQLKATYENQYYAVKPIPFLLDRNFCVNEIFVDGGIQISSSINKKQGQVVWNTIDSYHSILINSQIESTIRVVEGDPGHGKSTIALKLAYDWCTQNSLSPLLNTGIFICLRLRQLGSIMSIYEGIKCCLLPRDTSLTAYDIKTILQSSKSVVVVLEGYDEYPDQYLNEDNDITHIIKRNMFQRFLVILTTRTHIVPKAIAPHACIRLTGFDERAQNAYIRKAVVLDDPRAAEQVLQRIQKNPVLGEICQVPLFFVLFAHLTHENNLETNFETVTSFFRYIISCFHSHFLNKVEHESKVFFTNFEQNHSKLDEIAFNSLVSGQQNNSWNKEDVRKNIGHDFYDHYIKVGILVEEDIIEITDKPGVSESQHIQHKTFVKFFHQLFCEWYAAHFLATYSENAELTNLRNKFKKLDPFNYQYVYRFACGLNPKFADSIIDYLTTLPDGYKLTVLCVLEKTGKLMDIKQRLQELCLATVSISASDSRLLQRSSLQLIEIASKVEIPVTCIQFENCFSSVADNKKYILLNSGLQVHRISSVSELKITEMGREFLHEVVSGILEYALTCKDLHKMTFECCLLPQTLKDIELLNNIQSKDITVAWIPTAKWFILDSAGQWKERYGGKAMTYELYQNEVEEFRIEWSDTSWQVSSS